MKDMTDLFCDDYNGVLPNTKCVPSRHQYRLHWDMGTNNVQTGKRYLVVMVDRFSKWVEANTTAKEDGKSVIKRLQTELIPRYGVPRQIRLFKPTPETGGGEIRNCTQV